MNLRESYIKKCSDLIKKALADLGVTEDTLIHETPPERKMGDIAYPMFKYAKQLKMNPALIAGKVAEAIGEARFIEKLETKGPYLNIFLKKETVARELLTAIINRGGDFGTGEDKNEKVLVEFSCPNTNKPLHLGHCRNNALGDSISRILAKNGFEVQKVNLINDRGIHICKSMLAYDKFGGNTTPESEGKKSDHLVGDFYVRYDKEAKKDKSLEDEAQQMLRKWEDKDEHVRDLWKKMNSWAIDGINKTYKRMGIGFDKVQYESETYLFGKEIVMDGLEKGVFYKEEDESVWINNEDVGLDKKILLRSDGTSIYITQDLGTAVKRHEQLSFDRMVYVVGSEQIYHFKTLFAILKKLGFDWGERCLHLSYGMVNLPEGKMKSREGTVIDADNLMDLLFSLALETVKEKHPGWNEGEQKETAEKIGLAALKYYLLNFSTGKDVMFIPEQSISFDGNTGPYIQYTTARIFSLLAKAADEEHNQQHFEGYEYNDDEWNVIAQLLDFETALQRSASESSPSELCSYLYTLTKLFNKFYHDNPVIQADSPAGRDIRLQICRTVRIILVTGLNLLGISALEKM